MQLVYNYSFILVACLVLGSWAFNGYGAGYAPPNFRVAQYKPTIVSQCSLYEGPVCGRTKKCRYSFYNLCDLEKANTASLKWEIDHFGACKEDCSQTTTTPAPTGGTASNCTSSTPVQVPITDSMHQITISAYVQPIYSAISVGGSTSIGENGQIVRTG